MAASSDFNFLSEDDPIFLPVDLATRGAALVGYLLLRWNMDCTPNHPLQGPEYKPGCSMPAHCATPPTTPQPTSLSPPACCLPRHLSGEITLSEAETELQDVAHA